MLLVYRIKIIVKIRVNMKKFNNMIKIILKQLLDYNLI